MTQNYKNIKEAHSKFNFPGSYRIGTLIKDNIVIRIYSNSETAPDYFKNNNKYFYYIIKNEKIYNAFKNSKKENIFIHLFKKNLEKQNVKYYGLYKVKGFRENKKYVLLEKVY
tara:strand:- start:100 stop:438 length:339 start_codon:yes stop_codon:yes gene_type:complete